VFGVAVLLIVMVVVLITGKDAAAVVRHIVSTDKYQQVTGTVGRSWIDTKYDTDGFPAFYPRATYSYVLGNRSYTSTQVAPVDFPLSQSRAAEFLREYASGNTVVVYVGSNPARSYLMVDLPLSHAVGVIAVLGITLLLAFVVLFIATMGIVRQKYCRKSNGAC